MLPDKETLYRFVPALRSSNDDTHAFKRGIDPLHHDIVDFERQLRAKAQLITSMPRTF
jgi:hypothetical protein